jgi:TolB protein
MTFLKSRSRAGAALLAAALAACLVTIARAQLQIEVTSGVTDPIPIAVVPFAGAIPTDASAGASVADVVEHDLASSGRFRLMPHNQMRATPSQAKDVVLPDWRAAGNDYVVVGHVSALGADQFAVEFQLLNALNSEELANRRFTGPANALRDAAHQVSDLIYQKILGVRGAFATRIAYVAVLGSPPMQRFELVIADADGANARVVLDSQQPVMSPAWSPDGKWLAYVSFEHKRSTVYVQQVSTGVRQLVSARAGINGAPVWSPDGHKLAITLSGSEGNPEIYTLDLSTQELTRLTDDPSINTEPTWAPDGHSIYFTSDRGGGPQIYQIGLGPGDRPKRITFEGTYNAGPRISPDGTQLAVVSLQPGNNYCIAVQDLASGTLRVLSHGPLDNAPSFAPNGAMLIYSGTEHGQVVLKRVSLDGLTSQRLASEQADVRDPVWGPFLHPEL